MCFPIVRRGSGKEHRVKIPDYEALVRGGDTARNAPLYPTDYAVRTLQRADVGRAAARIRLSIAILTAASVC
jgi:hypothetical protein